jgi:hypothetical protein
MLTEHNDCRIRNICFCCMIVVDSKWRFEMCCQYDLWLPNTAWVRKIRNGYPLTNQLPHSEATTIRPARRTCGLQNGCVSNNDMYKWSLLCVIYLWVPVSMLDATLSCMPNATQWPNLATHPSKTCRNASGNIDTIHITHVVRHLIYGGRTQPQRNIRNRCPPIKQMHTKQQI